MGVKGFQIEGDRNRLGTALSSLGYHFLFQLSFRCYS